jgi:surface protein
MARLFEEICAKIGPPNNINSLGASTYYSTTLFMVNTHAFLPSTLAPTLLGRCAANAAKPGIWAFALAALMLCPWRAQAQADAFIITVKTDNAGTSNSTSFTIPTIGGGYNYEVDWDDDGIYDDSGLMSDATHDYGAAGTYTLRIRGAFPRIYFDNAGDYLKLLDVVQWGNSAWTSMERAFGGCSNLNITATDLPDLSGVSDMLLMFAGCTSLNGPSNIGDWNTSAVTNMSDMFVVAENFNQPIDNWNTAAVTNMSGMFRGATAFNQPIGNWNTAAVTNMNGMFQGATAFNQPIGNWNTAAVTIMRDMFAAAENFNQPIGNWNTGAVTDMSGMFLQAFAFNQPIGNWNTGAVTAMNQMFFLATAFDQPIGNWNTAAVTNMNGMFQGATAFNQPIGNWNTSAVTIMTAVFNHATAFNQPIGNWNTSAVVSMFVMFQNATAFNQPIGNWNTAAVTNMNSMLAEATAFNQPIGNWNTAAVTNMGSMFRAATSFDQPIGNWNTAAVTSMNSMFAEATAFNQPIGNWNTAAVTNMASVFRAATAFNQPIGNWNTAAATNMAGMFRSATAFNQPIGNWNTAASTNLSSMFRDAVAFNQPLGTWSLKSNVNMASMLDNCGMDCLNYSATLTGWANNPATPSGRSLGASGRQYSTTAAAARTTLTTTKGWVISGDAASGTLCAPCPAENPSIVCPANIVRNTDANLCSAVVTYAMPTYSDNCPGGGAAILPGSLPSGSAFPKGLTLVSWQATDATGLTAICQFTVTVNDAQLPNISCPSNITSGTAPGLCTATVTYSTPTATDNCAGVTAAHLSGGISGAVFPKGQTVVTWRATDAAGLTKTCTFRITVNDTENPAITCPTVAPTTTTANSCSSAPVTYVAPTATDNCGSLTVVRISGPASGSSLPTGTTNVVWRAVDGAGRSSTCSFSVTVNDVTPPAITCPQSVSVTAPPGQCSVPVAYTTPTFTDNCSVQSVFLLSGLVSGSTFPQGTTVNTWRAVDNSGLSATCSFTVTVGCGASPGPSEGGENAAPAPFSPPSEGLGEAPPSLRGGRVGLSLSPNPAATEVQVFVENLGETGGELTVHDAQGRLMWRRHIGAEALTLDLDARWQNGMYFVALHSAVMAVTKRLVVQRN